MREGLKWYGEFCLLDTLRKVIRPCLSVLERLVRHIGIAKCPVSCCNRICTTCHCQLIITNWDKSLCVRRAASEKVSICCTSSGKMIDWATTKWENPVRMHYKITQLYNYTTVSTFLQCKNKLVGQEPTVGDGAIILPSLLHGTTFTRFLLK